jgi:hypothetical protein
MLLLLSSEVETKSLQLNRRWCRDCARGERLLHTQGVKDAKSRARQDAGVINGATSEPTTAPPENFAISPAINQGSLYRFGADSSSEMAPEHGFEP